MFELDQSQLILYCLEDQLINSVVSDLCAKFYVRDNMRHHLAVEINNSEKEVFHLN